MADAQDLKSWDLKKSCGFKSHHRHHLHNHQSNREFVWCEIFAIGVACGIPVRPDAGKVFNGYCRIFIVLTPAKSASFFPAWVALSPFAGLVYHPMVRRRLLASRGN